MANAVFNQADLNRDGVLSEGEFRNFVRNSVVGNDINNLGVNTGYGASGFRSSVYESANSGGGGGGFGGNLGYNASGLGGAGYGASSYESSAYRSSVGNIGGDVGNLNVAGTAGFSSADAASAGFSSASQSTNLQYETDEQGNFKDPNPQVVRRPAPNGPLTYSQNIRVRFLQPPPVAAHGPLIIKEVRPPQPPAPTPLRVRQQAPPIPQPPPLILRERPPQTPTAVASQTVVRNLAAIPVPPRSVIIERIPPNPPKPRDIVIERWVPYGSLEKRKTIVQRAEPAKPYPKPQNIIIQYEPVQVRVIRQFQRLGVTPEDPQAYVQRYGASLFDSSTLVQQARAAGVVEDISPPIVANSGSASASEFSSASSTAGGLGFEAGNLGGVDVATVGGGGRVGQSSYFESSSYSGTGDVSGLGAGFGSSSFESSAGGYNNATAGGFNTAVDAAFAAADTNNDGFLTAAEFRNAGY